MIIFKKGQIIPRWLGVTASDRKAQHCIKFGGDCEYDNGTLYVINGSAVYINNPRRTMKNKTAKKVSVIIRYDVKISFERSAEQNYVFAQIDKSNEAED